MAEALLTPTKIYVKSILEALTIKDGDNPAITGMAHITGGGLDENVPRIIPEGLSAQINCESWELPSVFKWLIRAGNLAPSDMATTLNAGIGMVVIVPAKRKDAVKYSFEQSGERVFEIGKITDGDTPIILKNADSAWS